MNLYEIDVTGLSRGEQVLAYIDRLDKNPMQPKTREAFEQLGSELFKRNFQFISRLDRFFKPDPENSGAWVVLLAGKIHHSIWIKNVELMYYNKDRTLECSQSTNLDHFIQDVDRALNNVRSDALEPF